MDRVNAILKHPIYMETLEEIKLLEEDRIFCRHNLEHFINVARISYIMNLEENLGFSKELIYVVGLLHDIGRGEQYKNDTPHEVASYEISKDIMKDIHFTDEEKSFVKDGILGHRKEDKTSKISSLFYRGDKLSRECFRCASNSLCNWKAEVKNLTVKY